jgi:PAS domain S-box-containing protein
MPKKPSYEEMEKRVQESDRAESERKKAEETLRGSEDQHNLMFDNIPIGYQSLDKDGCILDVNKGWLDSLGYQRNEVIGEWFGEFLHHDQKEIFRKLFPVNIQSREPIYGVEFTLKRKDGSYFIAEYSAQIGRDAEGRFVRTHCVLQNITKRKQAEAALANAKKQWEATFDAISDWVSIIDKNHNIIRSNNASKSLVDQSPKHVVGKQCHEIVHGRDCHIPDCPMALAVNSKQRESMEIQLENGRWVQISVDPIINENKDEFFVHIVRDITDRKRLEVEKDKLEAQKRHIHKAESLTRMAGAISHNFNNQLQVVIGNLEIAMVDQPGGSENLSEALKAARKTADISALMLTYSGKQPGKYEPIDLSAACRQSLTLLQAAAPKGTILKADLPASGPVIRCNAGQIQQVIINLVTNAWESADESRRGIGLTVKPVSQKDIAVFKRFPADWNPQESVYACLEVVDSGCGIACKDTEKIFDPFFTTKFTGRGLGLSVVLGIVTAHNGGITLESQPGRGSVFRVFFPLSTEEILRKPDKPIQPLEIQEGGTVLLIEDEEQVRKMARTMLTRLGYTVLEAKDGIEAVEIFQQHKNEIRCVLSDLTMPRMNGWDTLQALRQISPEIPVILSSGYDEAQVMAGDHTERPNAFLGKPYRLQELKDTIRHTLAGKKITHHAWS